MPELPEVRTVADHLNDTISGLTVKNISVNLDRIIKNISSEKFISTLTGENIISVSNVGKWIIIHFTNDNNLLVHLRLEGKFRTLGVEKKHDHVIFDFTNGSNLFFNDTRQFGTFHLLGKNYLDEKPLINLGMEPNMIDEKWLHERLLRKRISIKSSMLDQSIVVGLGNIYINEVLWELKINPTKPSNELSLHDIKQILNMSHKIMDMSYKMGGSTISTYSSLDGRSGSYQNELKVHGKKGVPCKRCLFPIEKMFVGGRGTYYCPKCQIK